MIWWSLSKWLILAEWNWSLLLCFDKTLHSSRSDSKGLACEWKGESGNKEMWKVSEGYLKNESLPGLRTPQPLGGQYRKWKRFLPLPQLLPIWKHFTVQPWMWESDDLRESKWQGDSAELERRRQRKMRNGGEVWGRKVESWTEMLQVI